jgi:hypothetical protein
MLRQHSSAQTGGGRGGSQVETRGGRVGGGGL